MGFSVGKPGNSVQSKRPSGYNCIPCDEKKKTIRASVGSIARLAGVSTPAASFALKNQPGVSPATRKRILRIAKKLGYVPDARVGSWMARVREAKSKEPLPIAWLNTAWQKDAWQRYSFQSPYIEGAPRARAGAWL